MFAVLQWNHDAPFGTIPMVIAEHMTEEQAKVIARMNTHLYHRQVITSEELADMRKS